MLIGALALGDMFLAVGSITLRPLARLGEAEFLHDYRLNALGAALAVQAQSNVPAEQRGPIFLASLSPGLLWSGMVLH